MRADRTLKRFDDEALIDGFILVYANAAPGAGTNPAIMNSGSWQTDGRANPEVDDQAYLERVISDMVQRGVIDGHNPLYLVGQAGGAAMALTAAAVIVFLPFITSPPSTLSMKVISCAGSRADMS